MAIDTIATVAVQLIPVARGIEAGIARELAPVSGIAAIEGQKAGKSLGGQLTAGLGREVQRTGGLLGQFGAPETALLSQFGAGLQRSTSGASDFSRIGTAAFIGVGAAAAGFGLASAHAFLEGQGAQARYEQALRVTGASQDQLNPKLDATIKKMASYGFENDQVLDSVAQLTRATRDAGKSIELQSLAADLAAGRQIDLATATGILVKVETGHVALLGRLGVNVKDATGNIISQEEAIKRLSDLYSGSAAGAAKTYAGELRGLGATARNLEEEVGGAVVPAVANLGGALVSGVHGLQEINQLTHGWAGELASVALAAGVVGVGVGKLASGVKGLTGALIAERVATEALAGADVAGAVAGGAVAGEGVAAAAGVLGSGLTAGGAGALLAAAGIGSFFGTKKLLNELVGANKPDVDQLTDSVRRLGKEGATADFSFSKLSGDLHTISGSAFEKGFGLSQSSHQAIADIDATNTALINLARRDGIPAATRSFGLLEQGLERQGVSLSTISREFRPFLDVLGQTAGAEDLVTSHTETLQTAFTDLGAGVAKALIRDQLGDTLQSAKDAVAALDQAKADVAGTGQKSIDAARTEQQAQTSLSDAYRSQAQAATSLGDAKAKLAQFDSATDQRIRSLERQQITSRVVTTPDDARQKEIDLLSFDENTKNSRTDLLRQVQSAENGVQSATEGVGRAQQAVSAASAARRQVQVDAAQAIAGAERKAHEAILAAGKAVTDASAAQQITNQQTEIYIGLVDQLAGRFEPHSPLVKNLDVVLHKLAQLNAAKGGVGGAQGVHGPVGPVQGLLGQPVPRTGGPVGPPSPFNPNDPALRGGGKPAVVINSENHFHGADQPTTKELDDLNRKQGMRISIAAGRGG